ncbi:MAG TPA: glycosyltransferase [Anaerolineae bacterium]
MIQRIAMLSVHTCPLATLGGKETGGMNVYVRELTRELSTRGLAVDVFTRSQDPTVPMVSSGGGALGPHGRVIHVPAGPQRPYDKNAIYDHLPEFVRGVEAFAVREGIHYDLIHSHYWLSGLAARDLRSSWGVPIVQMFHTLGELKNRVAQSPAEMEGGRRIACEGEIMRFADRVVAATSLERDQMAELYGADPAHIAVVPPGVDLQRFRPFPCEQARASIGVPPDQQVVLFVGRIQPIKGIDTLIRAMSIVFDREPQLRHHVVLSIIGGDPDADQDRDESELARLQALRAQLGIGDLVTFLGSKDQDMLPCYYSAASMVVVPSHYESFGMVALEAMACGCPVIASDVGGLSFSVADGFNGYLVPNGDPEALAYKLTLLLKYESLRRQLGEQARRWVERYRWANIANEILEVYEEVLAGQTVACPA